MALLRVRIHVKRKGEGVGLERLGKFAQEAQKLIRLIGREVALDAESQWIAKNFKEGSLFFDAEYIGPADDAQVRQYGYLVQSVDHARRDPAAAPSVPRDILRQYGVVGDSLAIGESVRLGVFANGGADPERWCEVSKQESALLLEQLDRPVEYHGMVQGIIHSLYKEANPPYFALRELAGGQLVKCFYGRERYATVVSLLKKPDAVVLVSGQVRASRIDREVEQIVVNRMEVAKPLTPAQFKSFIGSAPRMTGRLSTTEFLDRVRDRPADG